MGSTSWWGFYSDEPPYDKPHAIADLDAYAPTGILAASGHMILKPKEPVGFHHFEHQKQYVLRKHKP